MPAYTPMELANAFIRTGELADALDQSRVDLLDGSPATAGDGVDAERAAAGLTKPVEVLLD